MNHEYSGPDNRLWPKASNLKACHKSRGVVAEGKAVAHVRYASIEDCGALSYAACKKIL